MTIHEPDRTAGTAAAGSPAPQPPTSGAGRAAAVASDRAARAEARMREVDAFREGDETLPPERAHRWLCFHEGVVLGADLAVVAALLDRASLRWRLASDAVPLDALELDEVALEVDEDERITGARATAPGDPTR